MNTLNDCPYYIEHDGSGPPICLPTYVDRADLEDITSPSDRFRVFMDPRTGKIHDGAHYAKLMTFLNDAAQY